MSTANQLDIALRNLTIVEALQILHKVAYQIEQKMLVVDRDNNAETVKTTISSDRLSIGSLNLLLFMSELTNIFEESSSQQQQQQHEDQQQNSRLDRENLLLTFLRVLDDASISWEHFVNTHAVNLTYCKFDVIAMMRLSDFVQLLSSRLRRVAPSGNRRDNSAAFYEPSYRLRVNVSTGIMAAATEVKTTNTIPWSPLFVPLEQKNQQQSSVDNFMSIQQGKHGRFRETLRHIDTNIALNVHDLNRALQQMFIYSAKMKIHDVGIFTRFQNMDSQQRQQQSSAKINNSNSSRIGKKRPNSETTTTSYLSSIGARSRLPPLIFGGSGTGANANY